MVVGSLGEQLENLGAVSASGTKYACHFTIQRFLFFIYKMNCLDLRISQFLPAVIFYDYVIV